MSSDNRIGRPRSSSRETLAEAACELFLEQGYEATSVSDITRRAGVSRSSFFNYFSGKADVLWGGLDERVAALATTLRDDTGADADAAVRAAVSALAEGLRPDSLALAIGQVDAMDLADELVREASLRRTHIAAAVAERLRRGGADPLRAEVVAAAYGGAVLAAVAHWVQAGAGRSALEPILAEALSAVPAADPSAARRRRVHDAAGPDAPA